MASLIASTSWAYIERSFDRLVTLALEVRQHPRRGEVRGFDVLLVVARHAAEHLAQAEVTRTIVQANQASRSGA